MRMAASASNPAKARIAIVHDWLTVYAGAERVLEQMLAVYPDADLYCVCDFLPPAERGFLQGRVPRTTFIQNLPGARRRYRAYLPLMPLAIEQLDLSEYDIVLSSSHAVAKGVLTGPDQLHVSYVYSPMRYAWDMQHQYLRESGLEKGLKSWVARWMLQRLRMWDLRTSFGVDMFLADSHFIARRIRKVYRRDASVLYPPVDVDAFTPTAARQDYYVTASRLVPYKRVDLIVEAFASMPERRLLVIGDGPEYPKVKALAAGRKNIELLGYQDQQSLARFLAEARAFVFAAEEDFGIAPLEAQACGTPVVAFGKGGSLETVLGFGDPYEGEATGLFFEQQTARSICAAIERFETIADAFHPQACRRQADRFSVTRFRADLAASVESAWQMFVEQGMRWSVPAGQSGSLLNHAKAGDGR
ncbi:MAG: glycosyltransferase family 4 protein [Acidobacteriota bacterium]|nr:glycosyltransferase family 4 protein [Acidobacteriota bacterium]